MAEVFALGPLVSSIPNHARLKVCTAFSRVVNDCASAPTTFNWCAVMANWSFATFPKFKGKTRCRLMQRRNRVSGRNSRSGMDFDLKRDVPASRAEPRVHSPLLKTKPKRFDTRTKKNSKQTKKYGKDCHLNPNMKWVLSFSFSILRCPKKKK